MLEKQAYWLIVGSVGTEHEEINTQRSLSFSLTSTVALKSLSQAFF